MKKIVILAGEPSGDLHAGRLIEALNKIEPEIIWSGTGGPCMANAGANLILGLEKMNFMGFFEVIKHIPRIIHNFSTVKKHIQTIHPDLVILVDYPGFNFKIARWCYRQKFPVIYYIAPQIWAWKESRIKLLKKYCQLVLCILPFEEEYFQNRGVKAVYTGHPLLEIFTEHSDNQEIKQKLAIFPGSRLFEVRRLLPIMIKAAALLNEKEVIVARAPVIPVEYYKKYIPSSIRVTFTNAQEALKIARYAFVKSGTSTLQAALSETPFLVCYKGTYLSYLLAKKLIRVPYISLVNLILNKPIVKEFIQRECTPTHLAEEGEKLKKDPSYRTELKTNFKLLRRALLPEHASENAARAILEFFKENTLK